MKVQQELEKVVGHNLSPCNISFTETPAESTSDGKADVPAQTPLQDASQAIVEVKSFSQGQLRKG